MIINSKSTSNNIITSNNKNVNDNKIIVSIILIFLSVVI